MAALMSKEETFFEIYDLIEGRLNELGPICTNDAWLICRDNNSTRGYSTICKVFRECMSAMVEQGKAERQRNGQWKIIKPNCKTLLEKN
jgi:hypothetical protein